MNTADRDIGYWAPTGPVASEDPLRGISTVFCSCFWRIPATGFLVFGAAAFAVNDWMKAASFLPLGVILAVIAMFYFSIGQNYERHFKAFGSAAENLLV